MKTPLSALVIAAVTAAAGACTAAPAEPQAGQATTAAEETFDADPALFVTGDEDTTIYLFGTVHMLDEKRSWFDEAVAEAFAGSDELIVEMVSPGDVEAQQLVMQKGIDPAGKPLSETLAPDAYAALTAELQEFGIPPASFEPMDPWFVAINLSGLQFAKLGMTPDGGVETKLQAAAKAAGKPVSGFETMEYQLDLFDTMPEEEQIAFLEEGIDQLADAEMFISKMVGAWSDGDVQALADLMNEGLGNPELRSRLLTDRNAAWAEQIVARLDEPGTVFVAVGAGHLGGDGSVQDMLQARGIEVRRVEY